MSTSYLAVIDRLEREYAGSNAAYLKEAESGEDSNGWDGEEDSSSSGGDGEENEMEEMEQDTSNEMVQQQQDDGGIVTLTVGDDEDIPFSGLKKNKRRNKSRELKELEMLEEDGEGFIDDSELHKVPLKKKKKNDCFFAERTTTWIIFLWCFCVSNSAKRSE